jgi:ribosomal-protein-alanine N-acetyltransferase
MAKEDLDEVVALHQASVPIPWSAEAFELEIDLPWAHIDLLREPRGGAVLALVGFWKVADEVQLLNIATRPDQRRRGLGSRLMRHVINSAAAEGCHRVTLEVRRSNLGAIGLYECFGFREIGNRPRYYPDTGEDALVLALELPRERRAGVPA